MLIPFKDLFSRHKVQCKSVLHLGANTGQEAQCYADLAITTVIWVEALLPVFRELQRHIAPFPGHLALRACLSDTNGQQVNFHVANNQSQSSSILDFGTHSKEHPTVKFVRDIPMTTTRIDTLLAVNGISITEDNGPWLLNADLQGAELLAMKGMGMMLHRFAYAYLEVNDRELYKGCPLTPEIDAYLRLYKLEGVECHMTGAGWGDKFYVRK